MNNDKLKHYLDFVPFSILTVAASLLIWYIASSAIALSWKHYVGLFVLPINYFMFWKNHQLGVIVLGFTLLLGLIGLLSYDAAITTIALSIGNENASIPIFFGQPIFLLWLAIHFGLSSRHYIGILTKPYWQQIASSIKSRSV